MSLVVDLPPAQETLLQREADRRGVSVTQLISRTMAQQFPLDDETKRALEYIEERIAGAPTDPEGIKEAEEDLRSFQRAVDETRALAGARRIYSDPT